MPAMSQDREDGLEAAVQSFGGVAGLAAALGISYAAVYQWSRVPAARVLRIERLTGIARERLRPDLYPNDLIGSAQP
jgi:DNA-binding transcriptional regulator YdaS (Cro superfamily)